MKFQELCELFEECGYSVRSYSGRAMYNRQCLGVESDNDNNMVIELIQDICDNGGGTDSDKLCKIQDVCELLRNCRTDSMGRGMITYWPEIEWENFDSEDSDDDSED